MRSETASAPFLLICFAAGGASLFFGSSVVATRFVVHQTDPATLGFLRYGIATLCFVPIALWGRRFLMQPRDMPRIALVGMLVYVAFPLLFNAGLQFVPAARGALILSTVPLFTLAIARLMGYEVLTPLKLIGGVLAVIGTVLALGERAETGPGTEHVWLGYLLMFGAALAGSAYNVLARPLIHAYPHVQVTLVGMSAGTLVLLGLAGAGQGLFTGSLDITMEGWLAILFAGSFGCALAFYGWHWALEHTAASRVAVFGTLNALSATVLGALLLGEAVSLRFLVGLAFVLAGILVVNYGAGKPHPAK